MNNADYYDFARQAFQIFNGSVNEWNKHCVLDSVDTSYVV